MCPNIYHDHPSQEAPFGWWMLNVVCCMMIPEQMKEEVRVIWLLHEAHVTDAPVEGKVRVAEAVRALDVTEPKVLKRAACAALEHLGEIVGKLLKARGHCVECGR